MLALLLAALLSDAGTPIRPLRTFARACQPKSVHVLRHCSDLLIVPLNAPRRMVRRAMEYADKHCLEVIWGGDVYEMYGCWRCKWSADEKFAAHQTWPSTFVGPLLYDGDWQTECEP